MTRLFLALALALVLATTLLAAKAPTCYITGNARKQACMCGRVAMPLWVCKVRR